jgi:subtilase-type serine protease
VFIAIHSFERGGIDIRVNPALLVGGALSYERSGFSTSGISGNGNLDTYVAGLYASYGHGPWYADATVGYAYSHGTLERSVVFPGVSRTAQGSRNANEFLSTVETGYRLSAGENTVSRRGRVYTIDSAEKASF